MNYLGSTRGVRAVLFIALAAAVLVITACPSSPGQPVVTLKEKNGMYELRVDQTRWRWSDKNKFDLNSDAAFEFIHRKDDAYAMIISERIAFDSPAKLMDFVLENLYEGADSIEMTDMETRVVNGREVVFLKARAELDGIDLIYEGYYYTGATGTIQFSAWTGENLFKEYEQDMLDLLNGLTIF